MEHEKADSISAAIAAYAAALQVKDDNTELKEYALQHLNAVADGAYSKLVKDIKDRNLASNLNLAKPR